ncbi:MAG: hypothetical protein IJX81_01235 [Clostridia bacterium]|nr:hypothetical protein [Clostridia bacterium]
MTPKKEKCKQECSECTKNCKKRKARQAKSKATFDIGGKTIEFRTTMVDKQ